MDNDETDDIEPLEVLRISTVVDIIPTLVFLWPLEVLRISTVVDTYITDGTFTAFGSAKNFYCCRCHLRRPAGCTFGSAKNFYCCRYRRIFLRWPPLEVLRISTVVDTPPLCLIGHPLEVLRISTVVDRSSCYFTSEPLEVLRISTVVDKAQIIKHYSLWKC